MSFFQDNMSAIVGSVVGVLGALAIAAVLFYMFYWRKYGNVVDISSLPHEVRWHLDVQRIMKEIGWQNEEGLLFKEVTQDKKYTDRLQNLLDKHLDGSKIDVEKVYAILNKTLISNFVGQRKIIMTRHKNSAKNFQET